MSFIGFEENDIQDMIDSLKDRVGEIEKDLKNSQSKLISWAEVKKRLSDSDKDGDKE